MGLQTSGAISLNDLHIEAGGTSGTTCSMNDSDIRGLISKGAGVGMSMNEWYGAANIFAFTIAANTANATLSTLATNAGWNGSAPIEVTVNSGIWVYATSTGGQGLYIDVADTVLKNYGQIIGQGGKGGNGNGSGSSAGRAIYLTQPGCVIYNYSGAYIAGGGGGGSGGYYCGGGGGAGGGAGGSGNSGGGGGGGGLGSSGSNGGSTAGYGGGAGGGGASYGQTSGGSLFAMGGGGGGGRILPGSGGGGAGGAGGSANNAGGGGGNSGGGGGGWGARGGYARHGVGSGGAAISSTQSYTLSNSGTIYGAT